LVLARAYRNETEARRIDGLTRDEACAFHRDRILRIARRLADRAGTEGGITTEDLAGYGVIGLLEAFDRYDVSFNVDFSTFVEYRVRGAMIDAIRTAQGVTRRRRQIARQIATAREKNRAAGVTEPGPREVAAAMGVDLDTYWSLVDVLTLAPSDGLHNQPDCFELEGEWAQAPAAPRRLALQEARSALKAGIQRLPERTRQMLLLYYGRDCSLAEIGAAMGVSPSRVCQVLSVARGQLRSDLGEVVDGALLAQGGGDEE
jgi:RNA polymerase sigma factor for flagellar operon FliA